jgi:hypothetical protein
MKLTPARISRYLTQQKNVNNYLLKLVTKDRDELVMLTQIRAKLLEGEKLLRLFNKYLVRGEKIDD